MSNVLVIGSNSFSGASFCGWLMDRGIDVTGVSRSQPPADVMLPYRWGQKPGSFKFQQIDLNHDLDALEALLRKERFTQVFNFAAQSMVGESWDRPDDWMHTNVVSAARLAERLRHLDFLERYVHVTTPEVYGSTDGWITEDTPFNPSTPYAVSRAAGDMLFKLYREAYGLPVVSTRAANVYGPGQQLYRIIPRTIFFLLTGKPLQLHGGGVSTRSFIHMDDVSEATWLIANEAPVGETYHISTDRVVSIRELVEMLCTRLGKDFGQCVEVVGERLGKDSAYWLDSQKLRSTLGWQDQISLEAGIEQTIGWVQDNLATLQQQPANYVHKP
ncbi:MAG: NAD-dependent epimerase/dehydratase family protein [Rhodospirillales bacterium]|nr:NAD-dependent epimerase/dehydratase family protein [Rhodospirillales bacterium]